MKVDYKNRNLKKISLNFKDDKSIENIIRYIIFYNISLNDPVNVVGKGSSNFGMVEARGGTHWLGCFRVFPIRIVFEYQKLFDIYGDQLFYGRRFAKENIYYLTISNSYVQSSNRNIYNLLLYSKVYDIQKYLGWQELIDNFKLYKSKYETISGDVDYVDAVIVFMTFNELKNLTSPYIDSAYLRYLAFDTYKDNLYSRGDAAHHSMGPHQKFGCLYPQYNLESKCFFDSDLYSDKSHMLLHVENYKVYFTTFPNIGEMENGYLEKFENKSICQRPYFLIVYIINIQVDGLPYYKGASNHISSNEKFMMDHSLYKNPLLFGDFLKSCYRYDSENVYHTGGEHNDMTMRKLFSAHERPLVVYEESTYPWGYYNSSVPKDEDYTWWLYNPSVTKDIDYVDKSNKNFIVPYKIASWEKLKHRLKINYELQLDSLLEEIAVLDGAAGFDHKREEVRAEVIEIRVFSIYKYHL